MPTVVGCCWLRDALPLRTAFLDHVSVSCTQRECQIGKDIVEQERPEHCRVGDHEDVEESDDGDDGQRRGANKRRRDSICQTIGLLCQSYASGRNSRSSFLGKTLRIMGKHTTGPAVETTSHQKWQENRLQFSNYVPFVVLGLSASSSSTTPSPTSPSSTSQDSVFDVNRYTENPVPERSGSTNEDLRGDPLHESKETENKK